MNVLEKYPELKGSYVISDWVEDGWLPLIDELITELKKIPGDFKVVQIKEKFGSLRFYIDGGNSIHYDIIDEYELRSSRTCEYCGQRGKIQPTTTGWLKCMCDKHMH